MEIRTGTLAVHSSICTRARVLILKNLVCQVGEVEPRPSKDSKKISVQQLSEADISSQTMTRLADNGISFYPLKKHLSVESMIKKIVYDNTIKCAPVTFTTKDSTMVCTVRLDNVKITNLSGGLEISFICSFHNRTIGGGVGGFDTINMLISNECIGGAWNMGFLTMAGVGYSVPDGSSATDDRFQSCINLVLGTLTGVV